MPTDESDSERDDFLEKGYIVNNKWKVVKYIGTGGFSSVYKVKDITSNNNISYALKIVKAMEYSKVLSHEYYVYNDLKGIKGLPLLPSRSFNEDDKTGYAYLVMELLGISLSSLPRKFLNFNVPNDIVYKMGSQCLNFIKSLHKLGYLYVDIKPENILLESKYSLEDPLIHFIDFGLTQRYVINGKHRPFKLVKYRVGTLNYMSKFVESYVRPSRRDDIISMLYVLLYLQNGYVPWQYAENDKEGYNIKLEFSRKDCSSILYDLVKHCENYSYDEEPKYDFIGEELKKIVV